MKLSSMAKPATFLKFLWMMSLTKAPKRERVSLMPGNCSRHSFNTMKILIIEDDIETREYVTAGHNIDSARDGYEGRLLAE